nr:immunoglobulin light chain junction region [Macaca mulatta]MPN93668.1 immunoglobulin light chain junction region [Macaca mulatta]MPN97920.1 immunoglobulin light chain junction region [Macaca mulatta]MPN98740.1 immunoglobulin light chain junction region [Macaca mulatta]MPN99962.1 immunoglobulin light chain junction region [Macaca mulatta]
CQQHGNWPQLTV